MTDHDRVARVIANWASPDGSIWVNAEERRDFDAELRWALGRRPFPEEIRNRNAAIYRAAMDALPEGESREPFRAFMLGYLSNHVAPEIWRDAIEEAVSYLNA